MSSSNAKRGIKTVLLSKAFRFAGLVRAPYNYADCRGVIELDLYATLDNY